MIPLVEPDLTEYEAQAAYDVIMSGWVNEGALSNLFAHRFAQTVGARYAVPTTSCTVALALSLMALNIKEREVIVPDITMVGTAMAVVQSGNIPRVVDVRPQDGCMDPDQVRSAINQNTRAIMPVHVNGRNAVGPELIEIALNHDLPIIEDAACCLGSRLDDQDSTQLGTAGTLGCFSLAATKIITTGQGGVIVTSDGEVYEQLTRLKDWGRFEDKGINHPKIGFNFKFTDIQASIGLKQLDRLPDLIARKKQLYAHYQSRLGDLMFAQEDPEGFCPWYVDIKGQHFSTILRKRGIGSQPIWPALHQQGAMEPLTDASKYPIATLLASQLLWLPSSTKLKDDEVDRICDVILASTG